MDETNTNDWELTEQVLIERLRASLKEVRRVMEKAPRGKGLALTEQAVLSQGREIMRLLLQETLRNAAAAQKGGSIAIAAEPRLLSTTR